MDGRLKLARQEAAQADPGRRTRQRNQACVGASFFGFRFLDEQKMELALCEEVLEES